MVAANQSAILNALSFDQMNERFFQVPEAAKKTFTWIFEDSDAQMSSNSQLRFPFKDWLASGSGIFHISGKPGSGKSTLMKYVFKHPKTTSLLRAWAGEKELVFPQFFFWKPGSPLQKNLVGLVRSLLFSVLQQCPGATPDVFPHYWNTSEHLPWALPQRIQLGDYEILAAFDNLVSNGAIYSDHRFCFFIDGLDEFEESSQHRDLVGKFEEWIRVSAGGVKICVSSRELPVFQDRLDVSQRIRLQDLTRTDIEVFVHERLGMEERFQNIRRLEEERCDRFEEQIVEKSDGVFLWVTLVLNMISEGLELRESLLDLESKLETLPRKLEEFFDYILGSISECQRRKAFCTLSYAMAANRCTSAAGFFSRSYLFSPLSLLRFSFLDEYINDPGFAKKKSYRVMHIEEVEERVAAAAAQVTGRCKGLLELRQNKFSSSGSTLKIEPKVNLVVFTHRSTPEYLADFLRVNEANHVANFDPTDALIQTLIAVFNTLPFDSQQIEDAAGKNLHFLVHEVRESVTKFKTPYFESLGLLDILCHRRQLEVHADFDEVRWKKYTPSALKPSALKPHLYNYPKRFFYEIIHVAISLSFYEYTSWMLLRSPNLLHDGPCLLMSAVIPWLWGMQDVIDFLNDIPLDRTTTSLRQLLQILGPEVLDLDVLVFPGSHVKSLREDSVWTFILKSMLQYGIGDNAMGRCWSAVEVFLEFGAEIPSWRRLALNILLLECGNRSFTVNNAWWHGETVPQSLLTWPSDSVSLQDFVDHWKPYNSVAITRILEERTKCEVEMKSSKDSISVEAIELPKEQHNYSANEFLLFSYKAGLFSRFYGV
jgi:hypothetical protein